MESLRHRGVEVGVARCMVVMLLVFFLLLLFFFFFILMILFFIFYYYSNHSLRCFFSRFPEPLCNRLQFSSRASGVVGYHMRLACARSPVRFRCRPLFTFYFFTCLNTQPLGTSTQSRAVMFFCTVHRAHLSS